MRFVLLPLLATTLLADEWTVFRIGPFEAITQNEQKSARAVLNHVEQLRHTLGQALGQPELKSRWPIRLTVGGKVTTDLVIDRDAYTATIAKNTPVPDQWNRALAGIFLNDSVARMPEKFERGLIEFFSTLNVEGVRVIGGAAPPRPSLDWARVDLLMVSDKYRGRLRTLLFNLQKGNAPEPSYKNAFERTEAEIETEAKAWLAAGNFPTTSLNAKPIAPDRDFLARPWNPLKKTESAMDAFDRGDYAAAVRIKPDWPAAKVKLAESASEADKIRLLREAATEAQRNPDYWRLLAETLAASREYGESYKAWGAAERAARDDAERAKMRTARLALENAKLDFEDAERQRKKDEAARDLERVKNDSLRSIRMAEAKANESLAGGDSGGESVKPVPWWDDPKNERTATGDLERVECAQGRMTLVLRDTAKKLSRITLPSDSSRLKLRGQEGTTLVCGPLPKPLPLKVVYAVPPKPSAGVLGEASSIEFVQK
ncbi:MAG: hypothetical protein K2X03_25625 [Bryobacteraceae bacterium]|nr:hypothetical protein [Bryobacteraceae bacterium]